MTRAEVERAFSRINVWRRGSERAPHKPLLILLALAHYRAGGGRLIPYSSLDRELHQLLVEFGPIRRSHHPELPFWHLQTDGIWEISGVEALPRRTGSGSVRRAALLQYEIRGGFPAPIYERIREDPTLISTIGQQVLESHFPSTIHEDILAAVGLDLSPQGIASRPPRDPTFRARILIAYEHRCAVCEFEARLGNTHVGLDAAHIQWHQAGGPDVVQNGIALCVLHHKLFDRGAFTISPTYVVHVSELVYGGSRFEDYVLSFHGRSMREPQSPEYLPGDRYLSWHQAQVFQGRPRFLPAGGG